jgi:L-tyrosine isonitrile desaturase/decarboxylase
MKGMACAVKLNFRQSANDPFGVILGPEREGQAIEELSVSTLRDMTRQFRLVVLRGFVSGFHDAGVLTSYAQSWGDIMSWPFGAVLDVVAREDATDHIFDTSHVPLHWDGMYRETIPEFQLFHCVGAPTRSERGRTLFTDTVALLADTDARRLEEWKGISVTYSIARATHYGGEICSPLIVPHPVTGSPTLRYNEPASEAGCSSTDTTWNSMAWIRRRLPASSICCTGGFIATGTFMHIAGWPVTSS